MTIFEMAAGILIASSPCGDATSLFGVAVVGNEAGGWFGIANHGEQPAVLCLQGQVWWQSREAFVGSAVAGNICADLREAHLVLAGESLIKRDRNIRKNEWIGNDEVHFYASVLDTTGAKERECGVRLAPRKKLAGLQGQSSIATVQVTHLGKRFIGVKNISGHTMAMTNFYSIESEPDKCDEEAKTRTKYLVLPGQSYFESWPVEAKAMKITIVSPDKCLKSYVVTIEQGGQVQLFQEP
jgi:hypothetical protein